MLNSREVFPWGCILGLGIIDFLVAEKWCAEQTISDDLEQFSNASYSRGYLGAAPKIFLFVFQFVGF